MRDGDQDDARTTDCKGRGCAQSIGVVAFTQTAGRESRRIGGARKRSNGQSRLKGRARSN